MVPSERLWEYRNRTLVLAISGTVILIVATLDWWTKPYLSLGFLYLFPIMLAAAFLPRWLVALLGFVCAGLAEVFSSLDQSFVRLGFETLALAGCGLFVGELIRNRRLSTEGEARLNALVETSPAAIVTVDERGFIELANRAAVDLMAPREGHLIGNPIAAFLPELHHALRWEEAPQFRASMQCRGHRGNGDTFTADVWFSTYKEGATPKVAAIIAEVTEEAEAASPHSQPALAGAYLYVPGAGGTIYQLDQTTGAVLQQINPFGTTEDPTKFVAGGLTADNQGNIYYSAMQVVLAWPWDSNVVNAWLVKVAASGSTSTVTYTSLLPNAPTTCLGVFSQSQLPWPPSANAVPPNITCGSQRPGLNVAPAISLDGSTVYSVTRAHFTGRAAYLLAVNAADLSLQWSTSMAG